MKTVTALKDMRIRDIEDGSLPPSEIKEGDVGTLNGWTDAPNGRAYDVHINGEDIFVYPINFTRYFKFNKNEE